MKKTETKTKKAEIGRENNAEIGKEKNAEIGKGKNAEHGKEKKNEFSKTKIFWDKVKIAWYILRAKNVFAYADNGERMKGVRYFGQRHNYMRGVMRALICELDQACKDAIGKDMVEFLESELKYINESKQHKETLDRLMKTAEDSLEELDDIINSIKE